MKVNFLIPLLLAALTAGACSGPPVVINKAVAAKKVDTTEIRRAVATTKAKLVTIDTHAEAAGVAVAAAESVLPPFSPDATAVPLAAVTLSPEQVIQIHLDFTKARGEILSLRSEVKQANLAQDAAETGRAIAQERGDTLAASDAQKTTALNDASGTLAQVEKEKGQQAGELSLYRKGFFLMVGLLAIYLFLRLSPWTRMFIP